MLNTQEKQKYCNILKVRLDASQEEITKAYRKMALNYHPDRNRGNEEWAKQEFIKVGEAYSVLSGKQESGSSNRFSSDAEFKKFEEMFDKVKREFEETKREFYDYKENKKQEDKAARSEAIRKIEEDLTSSNVSVSELDSSLWSPYGDWKEKLENSVDSDIDIFSGDMRIDINRAKRAKINNSSSGQGGYNYGNYSGQNRDNYGKHGDYGNPPPNYFGDKNFSSNNSEWTDKNKPSSSTSGDKIAKLRDEIEWNKRCLSGLTSKPEKQRCQKVINELERNLRELQKEDNSNQPNFSGSSSYSNDSDNKNETIEQLKAKIEQLKSNKKWKLFSWKEDKKLAEMEQRLSEMEGDSGENDNTYIYLSREQLDQIINEAIERIKSENKGQLNEIEGVVRQLEEEVERLRAEVEELKKERSNNNFRTEYSEFSDYYLVKKESELEYKEKKLEQLKDIINPNPNPNPNFPTGWVVGGGILVVIGLVITLFILKSKKKKKL